MLDIHSMICALRVMVLKKYADEEYHSSWKITLDYFLSWVGGIFILHCNFDTKKNSQFTFRLFIKNVWMPGLG